MSPRGSLSVRPFVRPSVRPFAFKNNFFFKLPTFFLNTSTTTRSAANEVTSDSRAPAGFVLENRDSLTIVMLLIHDCHLLTTTLNENKWVDRYEGEGGVFKGHQCFSITKQGYRHSCCQLRLCHVYSKIHQMSKAMDHTITQILSYHKTRAR